MHDRTAQRTGWMVLLLVCLGGPLTVQAQTSDEVIHAERFTSISVPLYKSRVVTLPTAPKRVSIGNPDIADVLILGSNELYILGKDLGSTNVLLWDHNATLISSIAISVTHDSDGLRRVLATAVPGEKIEVTSAQRNLVLSGQVTSALKMDAAMQIAKGYLQQAATAKEKIMFKEESGAGSNPQKAVGEVINLMTVAGAQEVMLQVRVAEVQRSAMKNLDAQFYALSNKGRWVTGGVNGGATFPPATFLPGNHNVPIFGGSNPANGSPIGPNLSLFQPNVPSIANQGLFSGFIGGSIAAQLVLDAAQQNGLAKILAEPTVTTLTGQEAQFLSGGSFPIPVPEQNGTIGIEYKDFGVKLIFQPLILEGGRIT